jgi:sugar phosphate isomerase/epimerase
MPLRHAFSTLGCPAFTLDEVLSLASSHGVEAVEIRTLEGTTDLPALFAGIGESGIRNAMERRSGVQILSLCSSFKLVEPNDADRAALLSFVPWAERLGVPWIRVFDGGEAGDPGTVQRALETLRWWRQLRSAKRWKVDIMIETHDGLVARDSIVRFCDEAGGVALLWDAHNAWRRTGVDPLALWPSISEHVVHIHVKDSVSHSSDGLPYTYVLPGDGEFPMGRLKVELLRCGYGDRVSLEWEKQWHPALPSLERALQCATRRGWW